jgi:hypothetical protein
MKMRILVLVFLLLCPMFLGACSTSGDKVENAEKFLDAVGKADTDAAKKYVCPDKLDNIEEITANINEENLTFSDIECLKDGDNVQCTFKVVLGENDVRDGNIGFIMENNLVCEIKE